MLEESGKIGFLDIEKLKKIIITSNEHNLQWVTQNWACNKSLEI